MTDDIRAVLSPLLTISFIFGIKIIEFPVGQPRFWYSFLYILILWSLYFTLLACTVTHHIHSFLYQVGFAMNVLTAILSVLLGIYHDKKFRSCLRKLAIVDDTLKKLGVMIDYHKLYMRVLWTILGWLGYSLWTIYSDILWNRSQYKIRKSIYIFFMLEYSSYINFLNDLIVTSILGYIELKFNQINKHIGKLEGDKMYTVKRVWEDTILQPHPATHSKSINSENVIWIAIHLHLELCKISRNLNSIFGLQLTIKMGIYFVFITLSFSELFNIMMLNNYEHKYMLHLVLIIMYLTQIAFRLFIINYMCEKVSTKANAIGNVISRIPYSTYDVVVRENISQFLLQMSLVRLKFYGLGLFQFGFRFLQQFCVSVTTVIVILVQSYNNT